MVGCDLVAREGIEQQEHRLKAKLVLSVVAALVGAAVPLPAAALAHADLLGWKQGGQGARPLAAQAPPAVRRGDRHPARPARGSRCRRAPRRARRAVPPCGREDASRSASTAPSKDADRQLSGHLKEGIRSPAPSSACAPPKTEEKRAAPAPGASLQLRRWATRPASTRTSAPVGVTDAGSRSRGGPAISAMALPSAVWSSRRGLAAGPGPGGGRRRGSGETPRTPSSAWSSGSS